jgi:hypothetical protein
VRFFLVTVRRGVRHGSRSPLDIAKGNSAG